MIVGRVTDCLEARIEIFVEDNNGHSYSIDATIDTGYSGYLTLPPQLIAQMGLTWTRDQIVILGDGTNTLVDVFAGVVIWDGQPRKIEIDAVDIRFLVGMKMLAGHEVRIRVVDGGPVWIDLAP